MHRTTRQGQMQVSGVWILFKSINKFIDRANTFAVYRHGLQTNNQAAYRALTKWFKHSSKHSNKMVDNEQLVVQAIACWLVMGDSSKNQNIANFFTFSDFTPDFDSYLVHVIQSSNTAIRFWIYT